MSISQNDIFELNHHSPKIDDMDDLNITLKEHQLRMIYKCLKIEEDNVTSFGVMSDKPGTGKTYALLGLIYKSQKKNNLIVIPQNLLNQFLNSIHQFSDGLLSYKKLVCYNDILNLYDDNNQNDLNNYDILITTSLFYHSLATTLNIC
jgi:superfamily II DNA or RNA helicase